MENPLSKKLFPISELQEIRGVKLPVGLEFLQLVVTGPPGAGKTYYINQIGGWPNEGYIDLTRKGWWKDQSLTYRPREINLGLPFKGHKEALTVFDKEWIEASPPLQLEPNRIKILPEKDFLFSTNWRNRYIFEFLIPPPEIIYERRKKRHKEGYFPVDANLSLSMVRRQVADYRQIALYLHRAGISVYIREKLEGPPMRIAETGEVQLPHWTIPRQNRRPSLRSWAGWKWLLLKKDPNHWLTLSTDLTDIKKESRISHDGKGFVLIMGKQLLRFNPEIPLGASKRYLRHNRNWLITAADAYSSDKISGFARLKAGETVMIGASNIEYNNIFSFHESVRERHLNITNLRGDLIITPLSRDNPIQVVRDEEIDYREQLENRRYNSLMTIRRLLGYPGRMMAEKQALSLLEKTVKVLENEVYRQLDNSGMPGGLLELPDQPVPVIIGDLHGQINNLLKILSEENLIEMIENGKVCLLFLGDAMHSEISGMMDDMTDSILLMDLIFKLKTLFPENVFYLRGNHDSFDPAISKNGFLQGLIMRDVLSKMRGKKYVELMERFHSLLPYAAVSKSFMACHAAPPLEEVSKDDIINIKSHPEIMHQIISKRLKRQYYNGYTKSDVKRFRKTMGVNKNTPFIVGHTPLDPFGSIWRNVGNIKNHHILYSAHQNGPALFIRINNQMQAISYPAEPLCQIIENL